MENEKKTQKPEVTGGKIDKDVLDVMKNEDVLAAFSDDVQVKRVILNCFCELLSEIKGLRADFDEFSQTISVCSADKLNDFFKEVRSNFVEEKTRANVRKKVAQGHKKPKISK